jgi:hypothetical protein
MSVTTGAFGRLWRVYVQKGDDDLSHVSRTARAPSGPSGNWLVSITACRLCHGSIFIIPFANRTFGCMSSKASITEIMIASDWSSSITRARRSSGNNSGSARTPAIVVDGVQMSVHRLGFRIQGGIQDVLAITQDRLAGLHFSIERGVGSSIHSPR